MLPNCNVKRLEIFYKKKTNLNLRYIKNMKPFLVNKYFSK